MGKDPYVYPGTSVFINKLGIQKEDALQEAEAKLVFVRSCESLPSGNFDYAHLQQIHRHLFQDIYHWAGQERTVAISKGGDLFALPQFIYPEMMRVMKRMADDERLQCQQFEYLVDAIVEYFGDVNAIHPFREGNGRATRALKHRLIHSAKTITA